MSIERLEKMLAAKANAGDAEMRGTKAAAKREIRRQADEIARLSEGQSEMFAAMLAEMDSRIDEIAARTDKLLAQHL